jgi:hypothetical protein
VIHNNNSVGLVVHSHRPLYNPVLLNTEHGDLESVKRCQLRHLAMSDSQNDQQKGLPDSTATPTAKAGTRKKTRPTYSCLNCHKRKVKVL